VRGARGAGQDGLTSATAAAVRATRGGEGEEERGREPGECASDAGAERVLHGGGRPRCRRKGERGEPARRIRPRAGSSGGRPRRSQEGLRRPETGRAVWPGPLV